MTNIYINGEKRNDLSFTTGGSLEQTSAHLTSSTISVKADVNGDDLQEYDYIRFVDNSKTVFAGTILGISQQNLDNIGLSYRMYDLTISSNADLVANIYVDMTFPQDASVTQILFGNHPDDKWYESDLGQFYGILPIRVEKEGITINTVDDFGDIRLSEPAQLWGQVVSEVLDQLAEVSNAWWEITSDKVFNMRYTSTRAQAPQNLDEDSTAYNISVSRDAYTMYSAVRVVGGQAPGTYQEYKITKNGETGLRFERIDEKTIKCKYPLYSLDTAIQNATNLPANVPKTVKIGFKGLHDDDDSCQALMSYGSYEVEMKDDYEWLDIDNSNGGYIQVNGTVLVQVYARMVDAATAEQIRSQRGGSGIIEYVLEDENITSFADAALNAETFLQRNTQRATTISFNSQESGWEVGQLLTADLPYYKLSGTYQITSVSASLISDLEHRAIWEYSVEASTIDYRDKEKALFFTPKKITFQMDGDNPAADGQYINDNISIFTSITAFKSQPQTWQTIEYEIKSWEAWEQKYPSWLVFERAEDINPWERVEATVKSWKDWEKEYPSWAALEKVKKGWYYMGNFLTPYAKEKLLNILQGKGESGDLTGLNMTNKLYLTSQQRQVTELTPSAVTTVQSTSVTATYLILPDELQQHLTNLAMYYGQNQKNEKILDVPIDIDKTSNSPEGEFSLTISIRYSIQ